MPSNPPETQIHLQNFEFEHGDYFKVWCLVFFKLCRYKIKVKKQPIHRTPDPKGRSIRRQSAVLLGNCKHSAKSLQNLYVFTKLLELTMGMTKENGEYKFLPVKSRSVLTL